MHYYLATFTGSGTTLDPFRAGPARGGIIDLRANPSRRAGWAVCGSPVRDDGPTRVYLGDDVAGPSLTSQSAVESRLGVTLTSNRVDRMIAELLTDHARTDGSRWKPLRAAGGRNEIWVGGELLAAWPQVRGGAGIVETFDKADSDTLGPQLTWTELSGDVDVESNKARSRSVEANDIARADSDLSTADQYVQGTLGSVALTSYTRMICRKDSTTAITYYLFGAAWAEDTAQIGKKVDGAFTLLGEVAHTFNIGTGYAVKGTADGSTLTHYVDDVEKTSVTDTSITEGLRAGFDLYVVLSGYATVDNFSAADLHQREGRVHVGQAAVRRASTF